MPKMKTNKGVAKRFKITKKGKIKRAYAGRRHILTSKSAKRKRQRAVSGGLDGSGPSLIKRLLPYG
ncbi:MAG: 50S ribosomal protein L35 [Candidatus Omnitrophica bacterium]|nr:50S ribosomal protein L35 [Candidatus Omnitrophota bacterium]